MTADNAEVGGSGSEAAFVAAYRSVAPALFTWASIRLPRFLRSSIDVEDLVSEVCLRSYARFASFDESRGAFRSWLFGIANNVLREALTRDGRGRNQPGRPDSWSKSPGSQIPDEATSVSRRVARSEELQTLVGRLESLDEDDRRLLIYRGIEGLPHSKVAELLNSSGPAIEKRWQRLVSKIAEWRPPTDVFEP